MGRIRLWWAVKFLSALVASYLAAFASGCRESVGGGNRNADWRQRGSTERVLAVGGSGGNAETGLAAMAEIPRECWRQHGNDETVLAATR